MFFWKQVSSVSVKAASKGDTNKLHSSNRHLQQKWHCTMWRLEEPTCITWSHMAAQLPQPRELKQTMLSNASGAERCGARTVVPKKVHKVRVIFWKTGSFIVKNQTHPCLFFLTRKLWRNSPSVCYSAGNSWILRAHSVYFGAGVFWTVKNPQRLSVLQRCHCDGLLEKQCKIHFLLPRENLTKVSSRTYSCAKFCLMTVRGFVTVITRVSVMPMFW